MKTNVAFTIAASLVAVLLVACGDEGDELTGGKKSKAGATDGTKDAPAAGGAATDDPADPKLCKSRVYLGFDQQQLAASREANTRLGMDRARVKPFSALQTEYARVLGAAPASLAGSGPTFGQAPKNWFEEPEANAVALQTAYSIAFDGCLDFTKTAPELAAAPDATSAATQCGAMARKFWSKTAAPQEVQSCVDLATTGTAAEPDPRRRWAYACASVLSSAGFLTY